MNPAKTLRETAQRAVEKELSGQFGPVTIQNPRTLLGLLDIFDEAYKLASLCEDSRNMRMGGADPKGPQAESLRQQMDSQIIAVARAADRFAGHA